MASDAFGIDGKAPISPPITQSHGRYAHQARTVQQVGRSAS
jgi:hypothetical protein